MAIEHVSAVLHGLFGVDPSTKLVMLILAEHARRGSALAWPSMANLSRLTCIDERQVQRILRKLVADAWIEIDKLSKGGRGRGNTNVYRLNMPRLSDAISKGGAHTTLKDHGKGDTQTTLKGGAQTTHLIHKGGAHTTLKGDIGGGQGWCTEDSRVVPTPPKPVLTVIKEEPVRVEPETVSANPPAGDVTDQKSTPINKINCEPERQNLGVFENRANELNTLQSRILELASHFTEKTK